MERTDLETRTVAQEVSLNTTPPEDFEAFLDEKQHAAFTGLPATITIVEGDRVVERHTAHAVHKGEFMGVPATGKKVFWTENHIYRLRNGMIAETWSEPSFHDLIAQIKGTKAAGQAAD